MNDDCGCSEEYGPCEDHATVLAQREGASTRSADDLANVFMYDAWELIPTAHEKIRTKELADEYAAKLDDARHMGVAWLEGDDAQALHDDASMVETWLPSGIMVLWDDGYRIVRVHDDCPLIADAGAPANDDAARDAYEQAASEYREPMVTTRPAWADRAAATGREVWNEREGWHN